MPMSDPFNNPAFNSTSLSASINIIPNNYGRIDSMSLMPVKGSRLRTILVEERNGVLNLLPTASVGAPSSVGTASKRTARSFTIPHIPHDDFILPEDVQGLRAFGSENRLETVANLMAERLQTMRNKHAITLENLRMGALQGIIKDADGSVIYDLFTEFGIGNVTGFTNAKANAGKRLQMNIQLGTTTTNVKKLVLDVKRHIEANLLGENASGILVLCSPGYFDALTTHAKVESDFARFQSGAALRDDMRTQFVYGGVTFEEYSGAVTDAAGNITTFIPANEAIAFPLGTSQTFATHVAPADFNETANTVGQLLYAKQQPRDFARGWDLHTQSNPLPLCHRPATLVRLY